MASIEARWERYRKGRVDVNELADLVHDVGESPLVNRLPVRFDLLKLLDHQDPLVRHNALGALAYHGLFVDWRDEFGQRLLHAMLSTLTNDRDRDCRRQAAAAFGTFFRDSRDRAVMHSLSQVCLNDAEEDDV